MTDLQRHTVDASKWLPTRQQAVAFGLDGTLLWLIEGTRRGVAAIVVLGHDRFDGVRVERTLEAAQEAISMRLQLERQACVTSKTVDHHVEHLAAAALGNTGVIDTQRCFRNAVNPATGRAADSVAV